MMLRLIESLLNLQELSSVLIESLSIILRLDPFVISRTDAITRPDIITLCFHFFMATPENPKISELLMPTLKDYIIRPLCPVHRPKPLMSSKDQFIIPLSEIEYREIMLKWLSKAVELIQISAQRQKDDPLIIVLSFPPISNK